MTNNAGVSQFFNVTVGRRLLHIPDAAMMGGLQMITMSLGLSLGS